MASIKVKFRPSSKEDHDGTIYYQIIHNRKIRQLATEYHILPSEWNENLCMVNPHKSDRKQFVQSIRERIRWDVERINKIIRKLENSGMVYEVENVIDEFIHYSKEYTLFNYMENIIIQLKHNGKTRTSETYIAALNNFKKFRGNEDIMLDNITADLMGRYEGWNRERGIIPNTISFYMRILRAVYNRAVDDEIVENRNPFRHVYTGVDKTVKRALSLKNIKKIKNIDLSLYPKVDFARDMFLMSFYLRGMSFIDMAYLRKSDLNNGIVIYRRRKTGQQLTIAWTPEMQMILDKYPNNESQFLLPIIRNPNINERYAYRNVGYIINRNLKKLATLVEVAIPLTMYVARHSWASIAKSKGIPLSVISEGMGHDNETTTQIYLASLDTSVVDKANASILKSL